MMPLQRGCSTFFRLSHVRLLGGIVFLALAGAFPVSAQQVFIKRIWVNAVNKLPGDPGTVTVGVSTTGQYHCTDASMNYPQTPYDGNISNDPHIEFNTSIDTAACLNYMTTVGTSTVTGDLPMNVCRTSLFLCMKVGWANEQQGNFSFQLDSVQVEVFKYAAGSNPLDPNSTPPLRTFTVNDPGGIPAGTDSDNNDGLVPAQCVLWDGSINIQGEYGKSNGQYGFRATVATNQTGVNGNITISQTRAYPGGAAIDANNNNLCGMTHGTCVDSKPITVDVSDLHVVRASPTVVGVLTGVAAQPYNINYRISKDSNMNISVLNAGVSPPLPLVRSVVRNLPKAGEGVPNGTLQNGDSWNGRWDDGDFGLPGNYLVSLQANATDQYGNDQSNVVTRQIAVDPLQITDIQVQPLTSQSTSLAVLSYQVTEPAVAYVDIYPPGTQFSSACGKANPLNNLNDATQDKAGITPKEFCPRFNGTVVAPLIRHFEEQKVERKTPPDTNITFWDGRDQSGNIVDDGDYVFVLYASMPSQNGLLFSIDGSTRIWSSTAKSGFITISRGMVTISQLGPSSTVIGSSPPVAGLDPFTFSYSMSRDANVSLKIYKPDGVSLVRTLVNKQQRPGSFLNRERWFTPVDDNGLYISSGNYLAELTVSDPFFPRRVSTTTALFPINLFRITDVFTSPLLTGATDNVTLSYQLSQPMNVAWNIYPPGTVLKNTPFNWPPCGGLLPSPCGDIVNSAGAPAKPFITINGARPGRLRVTEFWDGRDVNGQFAPDGVYVYTLVAQSTTTPQYFATDQVFGILTIARGSIVFPVFNVTPTLPALFNSSQTVALPPYEIDYSLTRQSSVTVQILNTRSSPSVVRTIISGQVRDPNIINREFWDARDDRGAIVPQGFYLVRALAQDLASSLASGSTAQQTISVDPLRIYDVAISALRGEFKTALIAYQVSETMKVSIKIYKPGTTFDGGGNPSPAESTSLVKRIVGVRPARHGVTDVWDGTDLKLALAPDGNYIFRIVASTDISSIDTVTGNVTPGASLAEDVIIAEIPVTRNGSIDPAAEFAKNSFLYPNPLRGASGTFQIYVPLQADVSLRLYNIAGELVLDKNFGSQAADTFVTYTWPKTNQSGRQVAEGVYFMLIREEPNLGEKTPLQVVKKILLP